MTYQRLSFYAAVLLAHAPLVAQTISEASLSGAFFARETTSDGYSAQGTLTFDGAGKYTFVGTVVLEPPPAAAHSVNYPGTYSLTSSGVLQMTDIIGEDMLSGAFVKNTIFATSPWSLHGLLVAIPVSQASSNATLSGTY